MLKDLAGMIKKCKFAFLTGKFLFLTGKSYGKSVEKSGYY